MPLTPEQFGDALRDARKAAGLGQQEAAALLGVEKRTLQRYEAGTSSPPRGRDRDAYLERLRSHAAGPAGAPPEGRRGRPAPRAPLPPAPPDADDVLRIPGGAEAGAGPPRDNGGADHYVVTITRAEIERVTGLLGPLLAGLAWFTVVGDSMEPDFRPGERVFYLPTPTFTADGFHVVELDSEWTVKRVQRHGGGVLDLVPVNPAYQTERLRPLAQADEPNTYRSELTGAVVRLAVVGKVVFNLHAR